VPTACAGALGTSTAAAFGFSPSFALLPAAGLAAFFLFRAPLLPRDLDARLLLGGELAAAAEVARRGARSGIEGLLLRDAARTLREGPRLRPKCPGTALRAAAVATAAFLAFSSADLRGSSERAPKGATAGDRVSAAARTSDDPVGGEDPEGAGGRARGDSSAPPAPGAGDEAPADRGPKSGREGGEKPPGPRPPEPPDPGTLVPKPVAIEPQGGEPRKRETYVFEFPDEASGASATAPRRIPLREALPRARERAEAAVRRSAASPEEATFAGRYFERLLP